MKIKDTEQNSPFGPSSWGVAHDFNYSGATGKVLVVEIVGCFGLRVFEEYRTSKSKKGEAIIS